MAKAKDLNILVTAFEPSGDALAGPLIAELRRREPGVVVHAMGGPKMRQAGAELLEETTGDAAMGVAAARKAVEHRRRIARLRTWMAGQRLDGVIPTDSPAANWAVCAATRELQPAAKVMHLAAPQLWAWASWRIHKMRRLSDHVLCLLPFETAWFESRGMPATFVGHPVFDRVLPTERELAAPSEGAADVRLAVLPGSRASEVAANLPTMLDAFDELRRRGIHVVGVIAASDEARRRQMETLGAGRDHLTVSTGKADDVLAWADVVLVCSGTATLQVAAHARPMVILYNASRLLWHGLGRWIIATRTFTLPNLIAQGLKLPEEYRVPELVPHFGEVGPVVEALQPLMEEGAARQRQRELFAAIRARYEGVRFEQAAAAAVMRQLV